MAVRRTSPNPSLKAPHIEGITFRNFKGRKDYGELSRVMNASWKADHVMWAQAPGDLRRHYRRMKGFNPRASFFIAEARGKMVGCSYVNWVTKSPTLRAYDVQSQVAPGWRGRGLREALLDLAEQRARALASRHTVREKILEAWCNFEKNDWRSLLESRGYTPYRHHLDMVNKHLDRARALPLPPGIEVRKVRPQDYRRIWDATREGLRDEPNYADEYWTESEYQAQLKSPTFMPHMWQIAWDGHEVVGGVYCYVNPLYTEVLGKKWGHTERIFVRRPWRGKGVAKALISRGLIVLREAGMDAATLGVDADNPSGALRLYTKMGYEVSEHFAWYRKHIE